MKQLSVILLLTLLLVPICWNGYSLLHYVLQHTHTFCQSTAEHSHPTPEDCLSVFQLVDSQNQSQLPSTNNIEFQEIKQYLTLDFLSTTLINQRLQQFNFAGTSFLNYLFHKEVFHPPLVA